MPSSTSGIHAVNTHSSWSTRSPPTATCGSSSLGSTGTIRRTTIRQTSAMSTVRYLSLGWIDSLSHEVAESETLASLAQHHEIGLTQVVVDGPEGTVTYHLQVRDGAARFAAGPADPEDVRMEQDWQTAVAVATGELNAQEAFIGGGDPAFGAQHTTVLTAPPLSAPRAA